ncbi:MAG: sarcosine oxidase subunit alpha family protein [Rhodospirillaceae bacterium]|jgi:methylglutamate dehydrogenase subunit C|nr:sarcosine oxidase subunit alpha family protein [Rhodospirillaceae bacterium]MBT5242694.1 sarcosine oxidase subunit alpha family protein [Rhodospirillaceae bacterium]MBT5561507.1 sarcosine oxidase subunit alpha family protein [Rhodospirillaceae bacterium]MBT6241895.1 sarcosine oxidase subunit alpha family protein [Rhodospirillaceae bacterium]MBT7138696.1 sarcosine oxidase subunit alpha family protein [Rhodospirillaceae bacterium]
MSARRLPTGGRVERSKPLSFKWDGREYSGFAGDTLASALMANNQQVVGRSFKYHRPRGVMSAGVEESGAIVSIGEGARHDPNVRATTQQLYDGLVARGQNAWPSVGFDFGAVTGLFSRFFAAGFYYKTFMGIPPFEWGSGRGTGIWMVYEKLIRKAAGMGDAPSAPDPDSYEHAHDHCDVLVVGSGPAGLNAAVGAARAGLDVILVEQDFELGGDLLNRSDSEAETKRTNLIALIKAVNVRIMTRTTAFGLYEYGVAGLLERVTDHMASGSQNLPRQRFWTVRAKSTILATGALEHSIAFGDNDRPGVMTAAAAGAYLNRYGVLAGENIAIATNNDSVYQTAGDLSRAGARVGVLDARKVVSHALCEAAERDGVTIQLATAPMKALGTKAACGLKVAIADGEGWKAGGDRACDLVLVSGGWSPVASLLSHRGGKLSWDVENACFIAEEFSDRIHMAGSAAGIWNLDDCEVSGMVAGTAAVKDFGKSAPSMAAPMVGGWENPIRPLYEVKVAGKKLKSFVDPQHDVTAADVRLAHREGFVSVEHLKRYTTLGMASDQGKMGNIIGLALMAEALGKQIPEVGTTTFRPPYTPVSIGALCGRNSGGHFRPLRRTPMHDWNLNHNATMTDAGLWQRPWYFARDGETITEAYIREATTTRSTVGLCDVTSLGKIAIQGPDATELLNRVYTNPFAKLPIGKARYGIMLRDDGLVMDDGTTWRLSETEYFMTTTTAHAGKVMVWLEELLQVRWPDLKVHVTSVSDQWAGCAVAGPKSRTCLAACVEDPAVMENDAFPFMGVIETTLKGGIACRIARISFSGEMAFEVYVPSDYANAMMEMLWTQAQLLDGCLYGTEALGTLRIEKGHVTGAELDGRVSIDDAGLGKMASDKKSYIGDTLRKRPEMLREDRPRLVGVFPKDRSQTFNGGALLCKADTVSGFGEGWITGVTHSPELGHWIGIGFVSGGHEAWAGQTLVAADPLRKGNVEVEVVSPHMVDPGGERMHG